MVGIIFLCVPVIVYFIITISLRIIVHLVTYRDEIVIAEMKIKIYMILDSKGIVMAAKTLREQTARRRRLRFYKLRISRTCIGIDAYYNYTYS